MTITSTPHGRLKEERLLLKLTQASAAKRVGVERETWSRYESGASLPGMKVLMAFADAGADIAYILTGTRSAFLERLSALRFAAEQANQLPNSADAEKQEFQEAVFNSIMKNLVKLAPEESAIIENYRRADTEGRSLIEKTADFAAQPKARYKNRPMKK